MNLDALLEPEIVGVKKKKGQVKKVVDSPVLFKKGKPEITFLVDKVLSETEIRKFSNRMEYEGVENYQVVFPLKFKPTKKDLEKEVVKLFATQKHDLNSVIPKGSKILTFGRTLYSITESNDLRIEGFQDFLLYHTYFYTPEYKANVYPVDSYQSVFFSDSPEAKFFDIQLDFIKDDKAPSKRQTWNGERVYIDDPDEFLISHTGSVWSDVKVAWDLETKGLDPWAEDGKIICMTVSFDGKTGYYLPYHKITHPDIYLQQFLQEKKQIGANIKYDFRWLAKNGVSLDALTVFWDTVSVSKVINELQFNSLKSDAWIYTKEGGYDRELDEYKEKYPACKNDYSLIPERIMFPYAVDDARLAFQIYEKQEKVIQLLDKEFPNELNSYWSLERFIHEIRMPLMNDYLEAEVYGTVINIDELKERERILRKEIRELKMEIYQMFGVSESQYDITSPEQLGKLVEMKGWKIDDYNKKGIPLTNVTYLNRWKKQGYKEAELLLKLREKLALFNTYVGTEESDNSLDFSNDFLDTMMEDYEVVNEDTSGMWKYIRFHPEDNTYRVHTTFQVQWTDSGTRTLSKAPNLCNIPSHGEKAKFLRKMFMPPTKDHVFASIDFSGLQLVILTIVSGDKEMWNIFTSDKPDLHSKTASQIFTDLSFEEFYERKEEPELENYRFKSKGANFSIGFNTTAYSFAKQTLAEEWSIEDAEKYIEDNKLFDSLDKKLNRLSEDADITDFNFQYYWTVAEDIIEKYFETYPDLKKHIDNTIEFAEKNGYVRSVHGMIRRLPYLYLAKSYREESTNVDTGIIKNLQNIATNSPIQNFEGCVMGRLYHKLRQTDIYKKDKDTYVFTVVYDALDMYIHKDLLTEIIPIIKEIGEEDYPEYNEVPMRLKGTISDYYNNELWEVVGHDWGKYLKEEGE